MSKTFTDLRQALDNLPVAIPPDPWMRIATVTAEGLQSVGFAPNTELLLMVSAQGREVFDLETGDVVSHDPEPYIGERVQLRAQGIGPLEDHIIHMSGALGGGLPLTTEDGWTIMSVFLEWPTRCLFMLPPDVDIMASEVDERFFKLGEDATIRAFGFSDSGKSLVIATSTDVTFWTRAN